LFIVAQVVMMAFEYSTQPCYPNASKVDYTSIAKKIDVGGCPASVVELP